MVRAHLLVGIFGTLIAFQAASAIDDPYLWLEDVRGERSMEWVNSHNAASTTLLEAVPVYGQVRQSALEVLNSKERIPAITKYGPYVYNFWRDEKNVRGLWRRTTLEEYKKPMPAWETVLDLDALAGAEKENWVWSGVNVLEMDQTPPTRALVELSRGGGDAHMVREFDLQKKSFVPDGFVLPEAKSRVAWGDSQTVYVATDFGAQSLTPSGYPRILKAWTRGTPLTSAKTVFEAEKSDMSVGVRGYLDHGHYVVMLTRSMTFYADQQFIRQGDQWVKIGKPDDATGSTFGSNLLLRLRTDWITGGKTYKAGSLLAANLEQYLQGDRSLAILFEPADRTALASVSQTKNYLVLNTLENVASHIYLLRQESAAIGAWKKTPVETPALATSSANGLDENESDDLLVTTAGFLTPSTLSLVDAGHPGTASVLKRLPAFFEASELEVKQFEATSKDGTRIPYFQVGKKSLPLDGNNPTLLYGYGGFQISMQPAYNPEIGRAWLEKGGTYVVANIRGGGEFGPAWHYAARKENRQRAYDDFIAVAEDLQKRKVTSPKKLGIIGRSNGGLLMGVMLTERPDLFGAVVIGSPLLDMQRYTLLPAGASWIDEYGDPAKPEEWAYISRYSPYQNIKSGISYPPVLITTSTLDDRVHPGHARKFAARLEEMGHSVLYFENTEGGHAAAANSQQQAHMRGLEYAFLWRTLSAK